jgi:GAF domain
MESPSVRSPVTQRAAVGAIAVIAAASLLLPLNRLLPEKPLERWLAITAKGMADVAIGLACVLAVILCWRQPLGRSAYRLAAFLAFLALSFVLYTRVIPIPEGIAPFDRFLVSAALAGCFAWAACSWIEFCDHFPRTFRGSELPAFLNTAEPLGILRFRPVKVSAADSLSRAKQSIRRLLLLPETAPGFPRRFIDADTAKRLVWVFTILQLPGLILSLGRTRIPSYVALIAIITGVALLRLHYALSSAVDRRKILWVVEGTLFGAVVIPIAAYVSGIVLAFSRFQSYASFAIVLGFGLGGLCFVVCLYIGIFKEGALDPALIIKKTALFSILTAFILTLYLVFVGGLGTLLVRFTAVQNQSVVIFSAVAIAALFQPVKNRAQSFIDRRFFRKRYEYPRLLELIKRETHDATTLNSIVSHLQQGVACDNTVVFVKSFQSGVMSVAGAAGVHGNLEHVRFEPHGVVAELSRASHPSRIGSTESDAAALFAISSALLIPVKWNDRTVGLISVGRKSVHEDYDAEDVEFLSAVADQIAAIVTRQEIEKEKRELDQAR